MVRFQNNKDIKLKFDAWLVEIVGSGDLSLEVELILTFIGIKEPPKTYNKLFHEWWMKYFVEFDNYDDAYNRMHDFLCSDDQANKVNALDWIEKDDINEFRMFIIKQPDQTYIYSDMPSW